MAKKTSKRKPASRRGGEASLPSVPKVLEGYVVIESTKRPTGTLGAKKAAKSATVGKLDSLKAGATRSRASKQGRIVRLRAVKSDGSRDPGNTVESKAGYLDPSGRLKYQQG